MTTIVYTQLFEDYSKGIFHLNSVENWRSNETPDLDDLQGEMETLLANATAKQIPGHSVALGDWTSRYTNSRQSLDSIVSQYFGVMRDRILRGTMFTYMESEGGPIASTGLTEVLLALRSFMELDSETINANSNTATAPVYDHADNQGDWGVNAWSASLTIDVTGTGFAQLVRPASCVMTVVNAGFATQGLETLRLEGTFQDTGLTFRSPTTFVMGNHTAGLANVDVSLNDQGQQVPGVGSSWFSGGTYTLKNIDPFDIAEAGDTALGVSAYKLDLKATGKTPFTRESTEYVGASGARNGKVYLDMVYSAPNYTNIIYKDVLKTIPISDPVVFTTGGSDQTLTFLVAAAAKDFFDGLTTGDPILSALFDDVALSTAPASQTIILDVPLPLAIGDALTFELASDRLATIQTHFARYHNFSLPSNGAGGETISDTLAE